MTEPWRYQCPNGHVNIRVNTMNKQHHFETTNKYYCQTCGWGGSRRIDAVTGEAEL